jgi:hypothetical protein
MASNLRVDQILPSTSTNVAIGTATGSVTLVGSVSGTSITNSGITTVAAGSTSAPSITPTGDNNTGVFFPSPDTFAVTTGGSERIRVDSSGRLGIGTNSVSTTLHVQGANTLGKGQFILQSASAGQEARMTFIDGSDDIAEISTDGDNLYFLNETATGAFQWYTNGSERMRINNQGYVATGGKISDISGGNGAFFHGGAGSSYLKGDVSGDFAFHVRNDSANPRGIRIQSYGISSGNTNNFPLYYDDLGSARFYFFTNGGLANVQSNDLNLCDEREKKNIVNLDSTWDCLKHWELKKFHYNDDADTENLRYGVIAQQVAEYCPEVIATWTKQQSESAKMDEDGNEIEPAKEEIARMGVKEQQMMWMAIKSLQEAQLRIETLEEQNATQASAIEALQARLDAAGL